MTRKSVLADVAVVAATATAAATAVMPPDNKTQSHGEEDPKRKRDVAEETQEGVGQKQRDLEQRERVGEAPRGKEDTPLGATDNDGGDGDELEGVELLDVCDRLEHENLHLRQRLAKLELDTLQKEHEDEEKNDKKDPRLAQVRVHEIRKQ